MRASVQAAGPRRRAFRHRAERRWPSAVSLILQDKVQTRTSELQSVLQDRSIQLDPAEVSLLMHDSQVRLQLFDVRPEADFNVFHIRDAKRLPLAAMDQLGSHPKFDAKALKVFMAGDEAEAEQAWRYATAAGIANTYVLAGGVNLWLTVGSQQAFTPLWGTGYPSRFRQ